MPCGLDNTKITSLKKENIVPMNIKKNLKKVFFNHLSKF